MKKDENSKEKSKEMRITIIACVILLLIFGLIMQGCSSNNKDLMLQTRDDGEIVIGMSVMNYGFPFFQDLVASAKLTADTMQVNLIEFGAEGDTVTQMNIIDDMIYSMDIDVICLNPVDSNAIGPSVLEANDAGIPIVTVDVGTTEGRVEAHVSSDNMEIGRVAARYALQLLNEKYGEYSGTIVTVGFPQISSMRQRIEGFQEVICQYPDIKLINRDPVKLNSELNMRLMDDLIQTYPVGTIDIVFGASGTTTSGLLAATEAVGRTDFKMISVDSSPELNTKLLDENSVLSGMVVQFPTDMAREAIEMCVKVARGEQIKERVINTKIELVTRDTIEDYLKRMEIVEKEIAPYKR